MGFRTTQKRQEPKEGSGKKGGYKLITEGIYEVYIQIDKINDESDFCVLTYIVLSDVDQEFKKQRIFGDWIGASTPWKVDDISDAVGIDVGTEFETARDFAEAVDGKSLAIKVINEYDDYKEKDVAKAKYYYVSKAGQYIEVPDKKSTKKKVDENDDLI